MSIEEQYDEVRQLIISSKEKGLFADLGATNYCDDVCGARIDWATAIAAHPVAHALTHWLPAYGNPLLKYT